MNKRTHHITEGSMMVALVGAALLANRQLAGILEYALYWVLTFPILVYTVRYGMRNALIVSFYAVAPYDDLLLGGIADRRDRLW